MALRVNSQQRSNTLVIGGGADIQRAGRAAAVGEFVRERDRSRLVVREPLSEVARKAKALNPEAQEIVERPPAAQ